MRTRFHLALSNAISCLDNWHISYRTIRPIVPFLLALCIVTISACLDTQIIGDNSKYDLVYQAGAGLDQGIYLANYGDKQTKRITSTDIRTKSPAWSPDGMKIGFVGWPREGQSITQSIYIFDLSNSQTKQLNVPTSVAGIHDNLTWSPNGQYIAYTGVSTDGEHLTLYTIDVTTQQSLKITDELSSPSWSPDGALLAAIGPIDPKGSSGLCLVDLSKHSQRCFDSVTLNTELKSIVGLTFDAIQAPFWYPSGLRIGFIGTTKNGNGLYSINPSGSDLQQLLAPITLGLCSPNFAPSGKTLILSECQEEKDSIDVLEIGSDHLVPLDFGLYAKSPSWRPTKVD